MNRTTVVSIILMVAMLEPAAAQTPAPGPADAAQADPIAEVVASIQAAEQRLKSARLELHTRGELPGGLTVATRGVLHVLRGEQAAVHTAFEFELGDGVGGRLESAWTKTGIVLFEDDPAFGEVYVHLEPDLVADLEWAGEVLRRSELPGAADGRAGAPLGSAMLAALRRSFAFEIDARTERDGEAGRWLTGKRRTGLDEQDPDVPVAERVEVFVRNRDHAVVEVRYLEGDKVQQQIVVGSLQIDLELPAKVFEVDGKGQTLRPVRQHQPMWESIEQTLRQAEAKSKDGVVRPSRR